MSWHRKTIAASFSVYYTLFFLLKIIQNIFKIHLNTLAAVMMRQFTFAAAKTHNVTIVQKKKISPIYWYCFGTMSLSYNAPLSLQHTVSTDHDSLVDMVTNNMVLIMELQQSGKPVKVTNSSVTSCRRCSRDIQGLW